MHVKCEVSINWTAKFYVSPLSLIKKYNGTLHPILETYLKTLCSGYIRQEKIFQRNECMFQYVHGE